MKKNLAMCLFLCLTSLVGVAQTPGSLNIASVSAYRWPSPSPALMRARGGTPWSWIESARGQYSPTFASLDVWIANSEKNNAQLLYAFYGIPSWASSGSTIPPYDLNYANETCESPLAGVVRPEGDCIWAEFVTAFMRHVCGVTAAPSVPLKGTCKIRRFEAWNEFNDGQFWESNYTDMAKMANDAAVIVRKYCGDCVFMAGNVSAGGDGYNARYVGDPAVSPRFDVALGQFLDAWHAIPGASLPNAVSFHAYGARYSVVPYPFPETVVSHGSPLCTAANTPNLNCRTSIFGQTATVRAVLAQRPWAAGLPIWASEGGYGRNDDLTDDVSQSDMNTTFLRQAYVARWMLAMASSGTVANFWYAFDDTCWGTMMGYGASTSAAGCGADPVNPPGYLPIHQTWVQMISFLNGATFAGPCTSSATVWSCTITRTGYKGTFMWTTAWLQTHSVTISSQYRQYRDLHGTVHLLNGATTVTLSNQPLLLEE